MVNDAFEILKMFAGSQQGIQQLMDNGSISAMAKVISKELFGNLHYFLSKKGNYFLLINDILISTCIQYINLALDKDRSTKSVMTVLA
jgi:hypothetical protein